MNKFRQFLKREVRTIIKPKKRKKYNKIFCVGWLKTGTTSCGHALKKLGFKHKTWDPVVRDWYRANKIEMVIKHARFFESFDDMPWNHYEIIPVLDLAFPNSRFILLERDEDSWVNSLIRFKTSRNQKFNLEEEIKYF